MISIRDKIYYKKAEEDFNTWMSTHVNWDKMIGGNVIYCESRISKQAMSLILHCYAHNAGLHIIEYPLISRFLDKTKPFLSKKEYLHVIWIPAGGWVKYFDTVYKLVTTQLENQKVIFLPDMDYDDFYRINKKKIKEAVKPRVIHTYPKMKKAEEMITASESMRKLVDLIYSIYHSGTRIFILETDTHSMVGGITEMKQFQYLTNTYLKNRLHEKNLTVEQTELINSEKEMQYLMLKIRDVFSTTNSNKYGGILLVYLDRYNATKEDMILTKSITQLHESLEAHGINYWSMSFEIDMFGGIILDKPVY